MSIVIIVVVRQTGITDHLLQVLICYFECPRIKQVWKIVSNHLKCNIKWKNIVVGYICANISAKICIYNYIISIVSYAIFKTNSWCKFEQKSYKNVNISYKIKANIRWYCNMLSENNEVSDNLLSNICMKLIDVM